MLGADVDALQCSVTVEEQARPSPVRDVFENEADDVGGGPEAIAQQKEKGGDASAALGGASSSSLFADGREGGAPGRGAGLTDGFPGSSSRAFMTDQDRRFSGRGSFDAAAGTAGGPLASTCSYSDWGPSYREGREGDQSSRVRVYSQSRHVDERKGEGLQPLGRFPFPRGLTEMQERMEEEWVDRERRLRVQHKRDLEKALAYETEKVRSMPLSRKYQSSSTKGTRFFLVCAKRLYPDIQRDADKYT